MMKLYHTRTSPIRHTSILTSALCFAVSCGAFSRPAVADSTPDGAATAYPSGLVLLGATVLRRTALPVPASH